MARDAVVPSRKTLRSVASRGVAHKFNVRLHDTVVTTNLYVNRAPESLTNML